MSQRKLLFGPKWLLYILIPVGIILLILFTWVAIQRRINASP